MKFVSEDDIQTLMDACDQNDKIFFDLQDKIAKEEMGISALLTDDNLKLLNEEEFDLLWFMSTIVYGSFTSMNEIKDISAKSLESIEEKNWNLMSVIKGTDFKSKLDVYFEKYTQEDLLAFIEDSLAPDEDLEINSAAREVLFVASITLLDALISHSI